MWSRGKSVESSVVVVVKDKTNSWGRHELFSPPPLRCPVNSPGKKHEVTAEPGTITLGLMGGLLLAGAAIRRRRNAA